MIFGLWVIFQKIEQVHNLEIFKISKSVKNSTFYPQNQNSDTTFISSILKVEETKVVSKF